MPAPMLHLICGKIAAGKSTLAARLGAAPGAVTIAEDAWLAGLYGEEMADIADYVRCAARLRGVMGPHVSALLRAGVTVVLDYPANTAETRVWMRGLLEETGADHRLHWLDLPDEACLARLQARNAAGTHAFAATEAQFRRITAHFQPPRAEEGLTILRHGPGATGSAPRGE